MRVKAVVALLSMLLELYPVATAAEEAPLPAGFLEFLAEMIEEEGELLDPLLLAPPALEDDAAREREAVREREPSAPLPAESGEAPESVPDAHLGRSGSRARGAGVLDHV